MAIIYLLAILTIQSSAEATTGQVKICPDGSTILASDKCVEMPDHRYLLSHEPAAMVKSIEWWCRGDRLPSMAQVRVVQRQRRDASGRPVSPVKTVELAMLKVKGLAPSSSTHREVRQQLESFREVELGGRCLFRRDKSIQSVLTIRGHHEGRREPTNRDIELMPRD